MSSNITGLIISAGLSKRMGNLKPLIELDGKAFLVHVILKLSNICQKIVIVTGYKSESIKKEIIDVLQKNNKNLIDIISWHFNPDYEKGMLTSLQAGLRQINNSDWILYHFADQPTIPLSFYNKFLQQIDKNFNWIQPKYNNQSGHPILFSKNVRSKILKLNIDQSLRDVAKNNEVKRKLWKCDFAEILHDYDTPQDLKRLTGKI